MLLLLAPAGTALLAWMTHDQRLHRLAPTLVRATRIQFLAGLAIYGVVFELSWVSAPLSLAVCGAMALSHGHSHLRRGPGGDVGDQCERSAGLGPSALTA
jgi:hypothetical protein